MAAIIGIPLFMLEASLGQFTSLGPISIFKICPLLIGLGYGTVFICWLVSMYYNVVISQCIYFLFASFNFAALPWTKCDPEWSTPNCRDSSTGTQIDIFV